MLPTSSIASRIPLDVLREIVIHARAMTPRARQVRMLTDMMRVNKHFYVSGIPSLHTPLVEVRCSFRTLRPKPYGLISPYG
jgi:hypothetical protein